MAEAGDIERGLGDPEGLQIETEKVDEITRDFQSAEEEYFRKSNIVGMGVGEKVINGEGTGEPCIKILVSQKVDQMALPNPSTDMVAGNINGSDTDVEEVGELFAGFDVNSGLVLDEQSEATGHFESEEFAALSLQKRIRPAEGGFSVGHYRITAGTIATAVYDEIPYGIPRRYYILSNNHVLANSNNASIGNAILQPGPYDGGKYPADLIARLSRFIPIRFDGGANLVDAAIAEGPFHLLDREIYWIGYVKGVKNNWPAIGEILQKTGRTTSYTTGKVTAINATTRVNYGGGRVARFVGQIVTTDMSAGGDSGSLVLDVNENAIGLLFAGSSTATIINHIYYVRKLLKIRIV